MLQHTMGTEELAIKGARPAGLLSNSWLPNDCEQIKKVFPLVFSIIKSSLYYKLDDYS